MTIEWGAAEPTPIEWRCGAWSLALRGDELADIAFDGSLVLRSVRAVVRDRDWQTVPVAVLGVESSPDRLIVTVLAEGLGARIRGTLAIRATGGSLAVTYAAESETVFERNRVGLVVLHPPTLAGTALDVSAPDGSRRSAQYPREIAPHQPALDIAGLAWTTDGVDVSLAFEGDVFEMEDQRNWTDASYKTYSTPLALPFPVEVRPGDRIEQSITVRCARVTTAASTPERMPRLVPTGHIAPALGVAASTSPGTGPGGIPAADFVLVELETGTPTWRAALARAVTDAAGLPLDVRIVTDSVAGVADALDAIEDFALVRVGVFSPAANVTTPELWVALVEGLAARGIRAEPVGGARSHFTELNRARPVEPTSLTFSVTPQMHAVEVAQLVESIPMQRLVAQDAVRIAAGRPVHVGPVTLRPRYNAVATTTPIASTADDLRLGYGAELVPGATDPRQSAGALVAWTIASYAALALTGVESVTFFEAWGARGVRDASGSPLPVATAIEWLHELAGHALLAGRGLPDGVWALAASGTVLAANLTAETQSLDLLLPNGETLPLSLPPRAAVRSALAPDPRP